MIHNYTLQDIAGTLASIPVFAIFLFAPGYCFGHATDMMGFRSRATAEKFLLSVPFSLVVSTMAANLVGRYVPARILMVCFLVCSVWVCFHLIREWFAGRKDNRVNKKLHATTRIAIALAALWAITVVVSVVDIQWGDRLYTSTALWDHAVRVAFVRSALRTGSPPGNPFCYLGFVPTARYYYYWYVLCGYPARLAHIDARYILCGSSVWAGFSLAALLPLYLKDFCSTQENIRRKSILGMVLLAATGLDILPTLRVYLDFKSLAPDMEWWNPVQITSWTDALIWVPHHVASLVACFTGMLALWSVRNKSSEAAVTTGPRLIACAFAALAFAAAAGLSVYVTFTFAIFLCCWAFRLLYKGAVVDFLSFLGTGCLTVIISLPYLHDLLAPGSAGGGPAISGASSGAGSGRFIQFGLREMPGFLVAPHFLKIRGFSHSLLLFPFALIAVYALEFGFFAVIGWLRLKRDARRKSRLSESEVASWYLIACSMVVITFVRSTVIGSNDLGFRSAMIAQFILLLWAAEYLDRWLFPSPRKQLKLWNVKAVVLSATLVLGFAGTAYSVCILRTYAVLEDCGWIVQPADWLPAPPNIGRYLYDTRRAYEELSRSVPADSIVQYNPMTPDYLPLLMYSKFQSVDAFPNCGTEFGGDVSACPPVQSAIADLFNRPGKYNIHELCSKLHIDALVVRESDPAWQDRTSWVWAPQNARYLLGRPGLDAAPGRRSIMIFTGMKKF